jgi:thiol-disulfide isomerase/thioredoxin
MRKMLLSAVALGALAACAPKADHDELAARVTQMEERIATLEARPAGSGGTATVNAADEAKAQDLYAAVNEAIGKGDIDGAKKQLEVLLKDYGSTKTAQRAVRTKRELDLVGTKVSGLTVDEYYVGGEGDVDLASGTTLVVFWEVWCPHCRREVPEMEALSKQYDGRMDVIGLTKITKSATPESVKEFITENELTYTLGKENGEASQAFAVSGIPAAAIVKDGTVMWRGHPGRLTEEMIESFL